MCEGSAVASSRRQNDSRVIEYIYASFGGAFDPYARMTSDRTLVRLIESSAFALRI